MEGDRFVLDTNIIVSGLLSPSGAPARILNLAVNGRLMIVLDSRIFSEYSEVLQRKKFSFPKDALGDLLSFIRNEGEFVSPAPLGLHLPDPGDLPFIEVAVSAGVPIVTGNIRHFRGCPAKVLSPAGFERLYLSRERDH